jgi:hypothetical protein
MGNVVYKTLIDGLSLSIDENMITVYTNDELDNVVFNFTVDGKLCGIVFKKEEFDKIVGFVNSKISDTTF